MYGTVTQYMGTAYTGRGIVHKYDYLIASAAETVFLKCPPTTKLSKLLNETAMYYVKRGYDIDRFMDPMQTDKTDAVFVKGLDLLFIQASHPVALEPSDIGIRHRVISFYDMYNESKLREQNELIQEKLKDADKNLEKALSSLEAAKNIHDDWEAVNIGRMKWHQHDEKVKSLKAELFGNIKLNKNAKVSHRLIGSMSSGGAADFIPSITNHTKRRFLIKGLPGTGKSTLMKSIGREAERRGLDVLFGWCGLDPKGVDLVLIPELSVCIFDATQPHLYDPEHPGDEILDLVQMCEVHEEDTEKIESISQQYREKILDASGYMQSYAQASQLLQLTMDAAIDTAILERKSEFLLSSLHE